MGTTFAQGSRFEVHNCVSSVFDVHNFHLQEISKRIAESEERRRLQDLKMPATQFDLERK